MEVMGVNDILAIIDRVCEKETINSFKLKNGKFCLEIEKSSGKCEQKNIAVQTVVPAAVEKTAWQKPENEIIPEKKAMDSLDCNVVKSPLVGTFYAAPAEDKPPYVTVGTRVSKGQVLGIVEAMKLMNEIECEYDGVVEKILVENGELVEYGKELFVICPVKN